ncbi:MAG: SIR2 family protein [Planctomycetes bacterium]|nr:SIR2 family protein [Planctomycetota bacterium]
MEPVAAFVGAGFSKAFGIPDARELWRFGLVPAIGSVQIAAHLEEAQRGYPLREFIERKIEDVELLLTPWSTWLDSLEQSPGLERIEWVRRRNLYEKYLVNLSQHLRERTDLASQTANFRELAVRFRKVISACGVALVTTNYDLLLENLVAPSGLPCSYVDGVDPAVRLFKLHGSVNWARIPNNLVDPENTSPVVLEKTDDDRVEVVASGKPFELALGGTAVLIPPIAGKRYEGLFRGGLKGAFQVLSKADRVLIVGYAFTEADMAIRTLLERTIRARTRKRTALRVVNPDPVAIARSVDVLRGGQRSAESTITVEFLPRAWIPEDFDWLID